MWAENRSFMEDAKFQSVIGTGKICIVEDKQEKIIGLNILMKQASGSHEWKYSEEMIGITDEMYL